jgi:hypothetical protein
MSINNTSGHGTVSPEMCCIIKLIALRMCTEFQLLINLKMTQNYVVTRQTFISHYTGTLFDLTTVASLFFFTC